MRNAVVAGAMLTGLIVTPALASDPPKPFVMPKAVVAATAPVSGYAEIYGQWANMDYFGENTWKGIGGAGRVNWWLSPTHSLQFDFQGMGIADYEYYYHGWEAGGYVHLSKRDDRHLFGVYVGDSISTEYDWYYYAANNFTVGAEAQAYLGRFTIYGQAGYLKTTSSYDSYLSSMWYGNLEGRFFATPNTKLAANIGFATGDVWDDGSNYNLVNYGAEIEHRFAGPLSGFARWDGYSYYGYFDNVFKAGIRLAIGQPTLLDQDRKGATLKVDDLPALWLRLNDY